MEKDKPLTKKQLEILVDIGLSKDPVKIEYYENGPEVDNLFDKGYLKLFEDNGRFFYDLSDSGRNYLHELLLKGSYRETNNSN